MDLANLLLFCLISMVIGAVVVVIVQYFLFVKYFQINGEPDSQDNNQKFILPDTLSENLKSPDSKTTNSTVTCVNLILQFLFMELRYSNRVRKWFDRKLSLELDELISKTTTGKLFDKLSIRDLDLGNQFPEIKSMRINNVNLHDTEGHIESVELLLEIIYNGNFRLSLDCDMLLGKKAFLAVKVKHLSGHAKLEFSRKPYTHWNFSFIKEPQIELDVETQLQGRQMQSQVTSLIKNQIFKAIRRKHTLPNYKLRFKPFFHHLIDHEVDSNEVIHPSGTLKITVREITRLNAPNHITDIYCTITLSTYRWTKAKQRDDQNLVIEIDIEIHKAKNQQIGIVFKQTDQVMVESVIKNTPAAKGNVKKADILLAVDGTKVTHIKEVAKILKTLNKSHILLRLERTINGVIKNDAILDDFTDVYEDFNTISFSKNTESVQIGGGDSATNKLKDRAASTDRGSSSESSTTNTPTSSPRKVAAKNLLRKNSESKPDSSKKSLDSTPDNSFPQHSTIDCKFDSFIRMNDNSSFKLRENFSFINVNVFGRSLSDNRLLGYLSIPINDVLTECCESTLYIEKYSLMPPETPNLPNHPLSSQSGFNPRICYGDILFSFVWNCDAPVIRPILGVEDNHRKLVSENSLDDKAEVIVNKQHNFIRTHFHRSTQCDFCGKKIWLKDAVQCLECSMVCHKKCVIKCQTSTVCGAGEGPSAATSVINLTEDLNQTTQPEFKVTAHNYDYETPDHEDVLERSKLDSHRQSFSDLLSAGMKRVNSANNLNNLNIPHMGGSSSQSKSLPPTPQQTPRKLSLANPINVNPFIMATQKLEQISNKEKEVTIDDIKSITDPLRCWGTVDDLMALAKSSSDTLYAELEGSQRNDKINFVLTKLKVALDSETSFQLKNKERTSPKQTVKLDPNNSTSQYDNAQKTFVNGQSEERIQILSIVMLYFCSALQQASHGSVK